MNDKNDFPEKRKHERFKVKEGVFAILVSGGSKMGQIKDIGWGGLTFQYIDTGEPVSNSSEVELFSAVYDFHLKKLQVKSVVDVPVENKIPFSSLSMRRLRVQFGVITPDQLRLLDYFLRRCTHR